MEIDLSKCCRGDFYKDRKEFVNHPNKICYIGEDSLRHILAMDWRNMTHKELIDNGAETRDTIQQKVVKWLDSEDYDSVVNNADRNDFIDYMTDAVFDGLEWEDVEAYMILLDVKDQYDWWKEEVIH